MSLSDMFKTLGAPLANVRWSWGSVRDSDSAVLLCVWQDEIRVIGGKRCVQVLRPDAFKGREDNLGLVERTEHVNRIRAGAPTYLIMCVAKDPTARPRKIATFNRDDVFVGGSVVEDAGSVWVQLIDRRPVHAVRA